MKRLLTICLLFTCLALAFQCEESQKGIVKAKVLFTGSVAADGCGWLVEIKNKSYSPVNLPEAYQKKDLEVEMKVEFLETSFQCGMSPDNRIPQLKILDINHLTD